MWQRLNSIVKLGLSFWGKRSNPSTITFHATNFARHQKIKYSPFGEIGVGRGHYNTGIFWLLQKFYGCLKELSLNHKLFTQSDLAISHFLWIPNNSMDFKYLHSQIELTLLKRTRWRILVHLRTWYSCRKAKY